MALLDSIKDMFKGKGSQTKDGIDKAADVVDDKIGGEHTDEIEDVADKAKDVVDKLDEG